MRLIRLLIFIFILPLPAHASLAITRWNEVIQLTDSGKKSVVEVEGRVKDVAKDQAMTAFLITFDSKRDLSITNILFEGRPVKYDFAKNELKIDFPSPQVSGKLVLLKIIYEEKYEKINKYLRQEAVYVPAFAVGAIAAVTIDFSGYELTSYLKDSVINGDIFRYTVPVPEGGIKEVVKFTPLQGVWDVTVKALINSEKPLGDFKLKSPSYFQASRQKVENYAISFSKNPMVTDRKGSDITYGFRVATNEFEVRNKAKIFTGKAYRKQLMLNMINYSRVSREEVTLLTPLLQKIRTGKVYAGMPTHAAIGKFIYGFMKYEKSYVGKLLSLQEIISGATGVCTEYAKLYDGLARLAGIPSFIVEGAACGEYDECQGHSWNMIFYDGRWMEVDPTWGLMSGVVSSSHVYFNDGGKGGFEIKYYEDVGELNMTIGLEMKPYGAQLKNY